jgi:hypothetical protein
MRNLRLNPWIVRVALLSALVLASGAGYKWN